jgi:hypothetical protein
VRNQRARLDIAAGRGLKPKITRRTPAFPTVKVAKVVGWKAGEAALRPA